VLDGVGGVREVPRNQEPPLAKSTVEVADENVGKGGHKDDEYFKF